MIFVIFVIYSIINIIYCNRDIEYIYDWFNNNLINQSKILLDGDVNNILIDDIILQIKKANNKNNIWMLINSDGGDLIQGIKLINFMDLTRNINNIKYNCICVKAISTSFNIFQLCDNRYVFNSYNLMIIHKPQLYIYGTFNFVLEYMFNGLLNDYFDYQNIEMKILLKLNIDKYEYFKKIENSDWIIENNLTEIKEYNLVDYIIV